MHYFHENRSCKYKPGSSRGLTAANLLLAMASAWVLRTLVNWRAWLPLTGANFPASKLAVDEKNGVKDEGVRETL